VKIVLDFLDFPIKVRTIKILTPFTPFHFSRILFYPYVLLKKLFTPDKSIQSDFTLVDDSIDVSSLFTLLDSLVDVSFDIDSDLELDDALDDLKDLAVQCEN